MSENEQTTQPKNYGADNITVLKGLEAVESPAMYIGDVGKKGLHHLYGRLWTIQLMRQWRDTVTQFL